MFQNIELDSRRIIRSYLAITGLYTLSASVIWGVNTLFLLDAGLSLFQIFLINSIFTGSMAVFEIPTGVLADTRGRRFSFLMSAVILFLGTVGYLLAAREPGNVAWFIALSILLGLGFTFYSGALEAWLVDGLQAVQFPGKLDEVFSRAAMVSGAAMLVGSIGGGLAGELSLSLPYWIRSGLLLVVLGFALLTMKEIGFQPRAGGLRDLPANIRSLTRASLQYGWQQNQVRLLMVAGMVQALIGAWGFYAWQPHFLDLLGREITWVAGVIAALIALSTIAGNYLVEKLSRVCRRRTTLLLWAGLVFSIGMVGVGLADNFWVAVPLYLIAMGSTGVTTPVRQAYIHQVIPSQQRATVISFDALLASGSSMAGQSGLGYLSDQRSLSAGYVFGGVLTFLALPFLGKLRNRNEAGDYITGDRVGKQGSCPAQGLPDVSSLESEAGLSHLP